MLLRQTFHPRTLELYLSLHNFATAGHSQRDGLAQNHTSKPYFTFFLWADLRLPQVFHEWIPQTRGNSLWSVVRRKTSWTPSLSSSFPFMLSDFPLHFVNTTANKAKINNTFLIIAIKEISSNIFQVKKLMTCFWQ